MRSTTWILLAGLNGLVATLMTALASHGLKSRLGPEGLEIFGLAAELHLIHAAVMLGAVVLMRQGSQSASRACLFLQLGIIGFSFSLYFRALMGDGSLGGFHWITPIGGLCLMAGWGLIAYSSTELKGVKIVSREEVRNDSEDDPSVSQVISE